jgi:N-acetylmuramoyl-L-alanine amidase
MKAVATQWGIWRNAMATAVALLACPAFAAAPVVIKDVRLSSGPDSTRIVFDVSAKLAPAVSVLHDPERVVIDLPNAQFKSTAFALPEGQGFAKSLRASTTDRKAQRVVITVSQAVEPKSFHVPPGGPSGHRIVLDLMPIATAVAKPAVPAAPKVVKSLPVNADRDIVIAIDAGHGGEDPGASGRRGTREKDVTLAIARLLKARIDNEPGMRAVLTRDGDYFLPLRERINRARKQQADMFVSVHADAVRDRSVRGSSVYVLSARGASNEAAKWLADQENAADLIGGVSLDGKDDVLKSVLLDLSQGASMSASTEAADKVLEQLDRIGNVHKQTVQNAGFVVLKSPDIPSMLVETAFISNVEEEARLGDSRHQQRLAEAIHAGVRSYFTSNPPPGTSFAKSVANDRLVQNGPVSSPVVGVR